MAAPGRLGTGLAGDRYAAEAGYWRDDQVSRDLTLIEAEAIEDLRRVSGIDLPPRAARRNIVTRGIRLNKLVGMTFSVGDALCLGTHRGDLRARLLEGATVEVGDRVAPVGVRNGARLILTPGLPAHT